MQFLKFAIIFIICFAMYSIVLWLLGYWSRRSTLGKVLSSVYLLISIVALLLLYFVRFDVGSLTVSMEKGALKEIKKIDLTANLDLNKYLQEGRYVTFLNSKEQKFVGTLPKRISTASSTVEIVPVDKFLISLKYLIVKIKGYYIVVTWGKVLAFIMSTCALFIVWGAGTEGKFAYLMPSDD